MERISRLLYGIAAILLLVGVALRVVPAPVGAHQEVPTGETESTTVRGETSRDAAGTDAGIVKGNIFSASRSAPRERYTPPDLVASRDTAPARPRPEVPGLRLFGTVSGTAALIDANPAVPGAEIYQIGDMVAGKRILAVTESTVVLEGPAGRAVLRLQPPQQPSR
jgi:hypothetical protein